MGYLGTETKKGLGKVLREISIHPFRLDGSSESFIRRATLPPGFEWFALDSSRELIVRLCYDLVWQEIENAFLDWRSKRLVGKEIKYNRVLILGNSGIGKTASLNFYIVQAVRKKYPVLIETREMRYFIDSGSDDVLSEEIGVIGSLSSKRKDKSVLFFVDHQPNSEPPSLDTGAFAVAPVSPAQANMKEFSKHKCRELWMPLPKLEEMIAMKTVIAPDMQDDDFQKRLNLVGCMPRLIFASDFRNVKVKLNTRILEFDVNSFITSSMFTRGLIPRDHDGLSWWIVRVSGQENLEYPLTISWGSDFIRDRVLETQASKDINILREASCSMLKSPFADMRPSGYYEKWCVYSLAAGKVLNSKTGDIKSEIVKLEAHKVIVRSTTPAFKELSDHINQIYYCAGVNNPTYDAAVLYRPNANGKSQLLLIQVTIGKTHGDFPESSPIVKEAKQQDVPVRYIFIVPSSNYLRLTKKQKLKQSIEVCEWNPCL